MEKLFVLVHPEFIFLEYRLQKRFDNSRGILMMLQELARIRAEEHFVEIPARVHPCTLAYSPREEMYVCGAYGDLCVEDHRLLLEKFGFAPKIHFSATLFTRDSFLERFFSRKISGYFF